uniref:N-acetyltransferase domain-containing protein n=1 Tax=Kalanchoe fedtschenkoi TaxID=63787 RepID=A0A7N0V6F7_KALFE
MIAEMPMVATCSRYRRQGMCRRLMDAIEKMLISLKIEKLVISALPDLVDTWTSGFGFQPLEDYEKESLNSLNLMAFPGTILLKKPLYSCHTELKDYEEPWSTENYSGGDEPVTIFEQPNSYLDDREVEDDNPKSKQPNNDNFVAASKEIESEAVTIFQDNMQGKGICVLKRDRSPE